MKVLVADDDLVSRLMLQGAVVTLGHDCLLAADGDQAWDLYQAVAPDVLITDRMMPGIDGLELCRRIRSSPRRYTYIVLATSLTDRNDVVMGMNAGADDYLTKPLDLFDLETRLIAAERVMLLHRQLAGAREELSRLASTDPLTQLRNRQTLEDDLAGVHARSQRSGRAYCLAMCDVDFFKPYNDTYRHQAGDQVLRAIGATMSAAARQGEFAYRYGGEEFLIVMPDQTLRSAAAVGERVRRSVHALAITHAASTTAPVITLSVGIAAHHPGEHTDSGGVLARADVALYEAKAAGRNRVQLAMPARQPAV